MATDVDEAFNEKPGGGALDEEHDETNNGSKEALPISSGGEAEALPEAMAIFMGNTGSNEDDSNKDGRLLWLNVGARWTCTCRSLRRAQVQLP
jgi:hypothetical protein